MRKGRKKQPRKNQTSRQPNTDVTRGDVPPRGFIKTHVLGFPQHQRQVLGWSVLGNPTAAVSVYAENVVLLNSPFDPDTSLGGVSASGFSKYMAVYTKCFVLGARYRVQVCSPGGEGFVCGTVISTNTTSLGSITQAINSGLSEHQLVQTNPDRAVFNGSLDIGKFLDKPDVLDDNQLFCTSGANPGQLVALHIWWASLAGSALTFFFLIDVEYDCVFTDPLPVI
jgi:hypothetical protein